MTPLAEPDIPQLSVPDMIALLGDDLTRLCGEAMNPEYQAERRIYLNRAKRNWRFVKGDHFLVPDWVGSGDDEYVDYVSIDGSSEDNGANQKFCYPVNLVGGDCWKYVAVVGQAAPNVKCVPDDLDSQQAIDEARKADISAIDFRAKWNANQKQRELAFHQYTTGPIFGYTRYVTNGRKYGTTTVPKMEIVPQPMPDGSVVPMPVQVGEQEYENGDVELSLCNCLQVAVPFGKKTLEECPWLAYEFLESKFILLSIHGKALRGRRNDEGAGADRDSATTTALEAQDATANPSGTGRAWAKNEWLYRHFFFDAEMYEGIDDEEKRKVLQHNFPSGLHATKVNDLWVDLEDEDKNDGWSVCKVGRGEYIMENPIAHDSIPFQRAINDMWGLAVEIILRGIPKTIVDQALIDRKSASENEATPAEIIFTIGNHGGDISKGIAQLPIARFSEQLVPFIELSRATQQDVTGIRPELTGGGEPSNTYREAKQRKDQAMMTLGPPAEEHGRFWEKAYENGTRLRAKFGSGQIKVQQPGAFGVTSDTVDMSELSEGQWHCEADEGVPMSFTERADRLLGLLKEYPPEVVAALGLTDYVNIGQLLHLLQIVGFKSPMEDAYRRAIKIIGLLAQEEPIQDPGQTDPYTGQALGPPQTIPSIPLDDIEEDPTFFLQVAQKWMQSPEGGKVKSEKPMGFENVKARARQARQMIQMAAMATAPPPEPAKEEKPNTKAESPAEPLPPQPIDSGSFQPTIQ